MSIRLGGAVKASGLARVTASSLMALFGMAPLGQAAVREPVINSIGMPMQIIPAGEFDMGSEASADSLARQFPGIERSRLLDLADEAPVHRVRITRPFLLGVHEVTVGEFRAFVQASHYVVESERDGTGGYGYRADYDPSRTERGDAFEGRDRRYSWRNPGFEQGDDHPVVNVTWQDAMAMAQWLSEREGSRYRLPSEAEWEYAARASGDIGGANGFDLDSARRWPQWQAQAGQYHDGFAFTAPVGSFAPNGFGLVDMIGNVWEWTADWYAPDAYAQSVVENPTGPPSGGRRVRRGGSWHTWPFYSRVTFRNWNTPETRYPLLGFRLARELDPMRAPTR